MNKYILDHKKINNVVYQRDQNRNIIAFIGRNVVGNLALGEYWSEIEYVDDKRIRDDLVIPSGYEFINGIEVEIENNKIATNMIKHAVSTTDKKGLAISKLFIMEASIHTIMRNLGATSIPDWYLLGK